MDMMPTIVARRRLLAAPSYRANPVHLGGSTYLTRGGGLSGAADSKTMVLSVWVRAAAAADGVFSRLLCAVDTAGSSQFSFRLSKGYNDGLSFILEDAGGSIILNTTAGAGMFNSSAGWGHYLVALDLADPAKCRQFVNNAEEAVAAPTNAAADFTSADWAVGANVVGNEQFVGDIADLMFWPGAYLNPTVGNRRMFISPGKWPVDPDASGGSIATLGTPIIRFSGATAGWHTNKGSGGGFTEHGTLTDGTGPVVVGG